MLIIPSIIAEDFEDFCAKVQKVSPHVSWVHLDVADGVFAPNKTWGNPEEIFSCPQNTGGGKSFSFQNPAPSPAILKRKTFPAASPISIEVHLMVENPENVLDAWLASGAKRIIYHFESTEAHGEIIRRCKEVSISVFAALREETPVDLLRGIGKELDGVLLFSGTIGFYGSTFRPDVILPKIKSLHAVFPKLTIEVDGGMNPQTAPQVVKAGATQIVSGSYIFESENVAEAIEKLKKAIKF